MPPLQSPPPPRAFTAPIIMLKMHKLNGTTNPGTRLQKSFQCQRTQSAWETTGQTIKEK